MQMQIAWGNLLKSLHFALFPEVFIRLDLRFAFKNITHEKKNIRTDSVVSVAAYSKYQASAIV